MTGLASDYRGQGDGPVVGRGVGDGVRTLSIKSAVELTGGITTTSNHTVLCCTCLSQNVFHKMVQRHKNKSDNLA